MGRGPLAVGEDAMDIRERADDSLERRHAIVSGLASQNTAKKVRILNKGGIICHRTDQWVTDADNEKRTKRMDAER